MPNLLNLVTKSVTNFWSGNSCPLIDDIKQEIIRNVDMKIILTTEVGNLSRSWLMFEMVRQHCCGTRLERISDNPFVYRKFLDRLFEIA